MTIPIELKIKAIGALSSVSGVTFNPKYLADDVSVLAKSFIEENEFQIAVEETVRELELLVSKKKKAKPLLNNHSELSSSHYQSVRLQKQKADLRLIFKTDSNPLQVIMFGHRHQPKDIYDELVVRKHQEP
ncbi:hypothetical protein NM897_09185 [Planococcus maritimus]|uniref:hypothetical protein n=1 Tax=Planococcus maritimus TaxID=192421 RepID=UPI0031389C79